jgi:hypothetical protein
MTNVLLAGFTSHWLRRESSHENRREETDKRYAVVRSVPSLWSGKREQILLDNKRGWKSTKNPPEGEVFFVDFSSYRTSRAVRGQSRKISLCVHMNRLLKSVGTTSEEQ